MKQFIVGFSIAFLLVILLCQPATSSSEAQAFETQAQQFLEQGQPEQALKAWEQAGLQYQKNNQFTELLGTQLNQAKAMQAMGAYRRSKALLTSIKTSLLQQSNSSLKANGLLTLGNILRLVGDVEESHVILKQSLFWSQTSEETQAAHFQMGNTLLAQQKIESALNEFKQSRTMVSGLRQLKIMIMLDRRSQAEQLILDLRSQFQNIPLTANAIYARIEFAENLAKLSQSKAAAEQLVTAYQQAQKLDNQRAQSYALGRLAHLYEQSKQWQEAQQVNQQALAIAQSINAPEILYQWQWQKGRLLQQLGQRDGAIQAYADAVKTLQPLRGDLVAITSEAQFSFREQIEPVYRELVDLLLQPGANEANLIQARQVIESLQIEELNNFFREACLTAVSRQIDQVDQTAAIFYPILLPDRLEVVLSLPNQPLRHYATQVSRKEMENEIDHMIQSMRSTSFPQERLAIAQKLYRWLIQPAESDLQSIQTLVFVLDGALRNVPIAALHNGKQYLVEQYAIALTPSLQLFSPRALPQDNLNALVGGLSESNQGANALPGVQQEVSQITQQIPAIVLKDREFTNEALTAQLKNRPFPIVHFATHGQFSSSSKETFIQTWNGRLTLEDLRSLLTQRDVPDSAAIELLVLSACQTAEGDNRAALGLAGVAIRAGARSTVASLWTVNDQSTAAFVTRFYEGIVRDRLPRSQAVRQAQLALMRQPEFSHPYYWAAFTLIGSWL
jgi:CHAT domain-containing protein